MRLIVILLCITNFLFGASSQDWLVQHQAKKTLAECTLGNLECLSLQTAFNAGEHFLFFEILEAMMQDYSPGCTTSRFSDDLDENKIHNTLCKIQATMVSFYHQHPKAPLSALFKAWHSFHFSKEEKASISYFQELQQEFIASNLTPLEHQLSEFLHNGDRMFTALNRHLDRFSQFYRQHGPYLIDLYTHKKMMDAALAVDCDSVLLKHLNNYHRIGHKKAAFLCDHHLLRQLIEGSIKPSNSSELKVCRRIKPLLKKLDAFWKKEPEPRYFDLIVQEKS